jgi:hypothetical protein
MDALNMHDVPIATAYLLVNLGSQVVVFVARSGGDTPHFRSSDRLGRWQFSARVGRKDRDVEASLRKAARDLVDVALYTANVGQEAWGNHEHARRT